MSSTTTQSDVREALMEMLEAQNAGDRDGVRSRLASSGGAIHIGTAEEEWWSSDEVADAVGAGPASGVSVVIDELDVHELGDDAAWAAAKGRFRSTDGRERRVRMSGVLVREDGRWTIVHSHASLAVPNEELFA
jgi:hypothetical protein